MHDSDYFPAERERVCETTQAVQDSVHELGNHIGHLQALQEAGDAELAQQLASTHDLIAGVIERLGSVREAQAALVNAVIVELQ